MSKGKWVPIAIGDTFDLPNRGIATITGINGRKLSVKIGDTIMTYDKFYFLNYIAK